MVQIAVWSSVEAGGHRLIKLKYKEYYTNMDQTYRTRWSGQGYIDKLLLSL